VFRNRLLNADPRHCCGIILKYLLNVCGNKDCVYLVQAEINYVGVEIHEGGELTGLLIDCRVI
jgi:hypothetical protein